MPVGERKQLAPPVDDSGPWGWARKHLFSSWGNALTTIVLVVAMAWILSWFLEWAVFTANFTASTGSECRGGGACWALIREKYRYIFFGSFPYEQHWRPLFAVITMLAMLILSSDRRMWNQRLIAIWGVGSFVTFLLMFGQIHIPLGLILFVALAAGGLGMILRGTLATPAELNGWRALAAISAIGLASWITRFLKNNGRTVAGIIHTTMLFSAPHMFTPSWLASILAMKLTKISAASAAI